MNGYKYLFKNIGLLTLSSFATKILVFFLVPLYTNILTTTEYGTYDLFNTTIGVLIPILTLNIQESVMRFSLEKKYSRNAIITIGAKYLLISNIIVIIGLEINSIFNISILVKQYAIFFFLMYVTQSMSGIIISYIRGIDKIAELSVSSVIASFVTIGLNIVFLAVFKWGLMGYFLANIVGPFFQCIYLIIKANVIKNINFHNNFNAEKKAMLSYCKPMIANGVAWWVNNTSDRYIVIFFCGLAENGVYSVASKIPSILNIFQSIFNQAWTLSAVRDFDPEDKNGFFANTYKAYNCMMVILCSFIIMFDKILAKCLYANDFYIAWKYVPWLTIAGVFGAMSGYIGGFFSAVKDSRIFASSSIVGAISNIILNLILTPYIGALGAAIATAVCYVEVWIFRYIQSKKYIRLRINIFRDIVTYVLICIQATIIYVKSNYIYLLQCVLFVVIIILYADDIKKIINKCTNKIRCKYKTKK